MGALADPEYQRRVWLAREYPTRDFFDNFTLNVHILYDDTQVLRDPFLGMGNFLRSAKEVDAMLNLAAAMDALFDALGADRSDAEYMDSPLWQSVVDAARSARDVMASASA